MKWGLEVLRHGHMGFPAIVFLSLPGGPQYKPLHLGNAASDLNVPYTQ